MSKVKNVKGECHQYFNIEFDIANIKISRQYITLQYINLHPYPVLNVLHAPSIKSKSKSPTLFNAQSDTMLILIYCFIHNIMT